MFALQGSNKKLISLYNIDSKRFVERANIKHQACKSYYYGEDLSVENYLAELEGIFAETLKAILDGNLPERIGQDTEISDTTFTLTRAYSSLLYFVCVTDFRNPVRKRQVEIMTDNLAKEMLRHSKEFGDKMNIVNQFEIVPSNSANEALSHVEHVIAIMADLNYKLLVNHTEIPFITSDYPVARYNQWLEKFDRRSTSGGYGSRGIQFFIPITDKLQIMVYDDEMYHVGKPKHTIVNVIRRKDVNQLNVLQFLNCFSNVYGNDRMTREYVHEVVKEYAEAFVRPNGVQNTSFGSTQGVAGSMMLQTNVGLRTNLSLSFIEFTKFALTFNFDNRLVYLRDHAAQIRKKERKAKERKGKND